MSDELICGLCLGGDTEVPPFGTIHDAEDLIYPCSTCTLVTHRKCLLDWFNSLPASKLSRSYPGNGIREIPASLDANETDNEDIDAVRARDDTNATTFGAEEFQGLTFGADLAETRTYHILILLQSLGRWFSGITSDLRGDMTQEPGIEALPAGLAHPIGHAEGFTVLLSTPCPQCKTNITFTMKKSLLATLNTVVRNAMSDVVQYGGILLGVTGAATGIVTITCVGLARCGLSMLDCLIPSPLLMALLSKKTAPPPLVLALFPLNFAGKKSDDMLSWNAMDQFRLSHVPVLPIMMYRMRTSSITKCLFASLDANTIHDWFSELVICNYISSLGGHRLVRSLASNIRTMAVRFAQDPEFKLWGSFSKNLLSGIDLWDTNNMIAMLVPLRWAYDLAFRVTVNRAHFELATRTRPRDIANNLNEDDVRILEETQNEIALCQFRFKKNSKAASEAKTREEKERRQRPPPAFSVPVIRSIYQFLRAKMLYFQACFQDGNLHKKYLQLKLRSWYYKTWACLRNDYSGTLLPSSITVRGVTTLIWPFLSADLGRILCHFVISRLVGTNNAVPKEKVLLLANIVGLVSVAVVKDFVNLYMSSRKAKELSQLIIVAPEEPATGNFELPPSYPGGYAN